MSGTLAVIYAEMTIKMNGNQVVTHPTNKNAKQSDLDSCGHAFGTYICHSLDSLIGNGSVHKSAFLHFTVTFTYSLRPLKPYCCVIIVQQSSRDKPRVKPDRLNYPKDPGFRGFELWPWPNP